MFQIKKTLLVSMLPALLSVALVTSVKASSEHHQHAKDLNFGSFTKENVLLTPHIAGWTFESHEKLAQTIVNKIIMLFE